MTAEERQPPPFNFQRASFRLILLRGLVNRDKLAALLRATRPRQVARGCYDYTATQGSFLDRRRRSAEWIFRNCGDEDKFRPGSFISLGASNTRAGTLARDDLVFLPLETAFQRDSSSSSSSSLLSSSLLSLPPKFGSCPLARRAFWRVSSSYSIELQRANFHPSR